MRQVRDAKRHVTPLTKHERTALLNAAKTLHPRLYLSILLFIYTGIRPGELLGLQWRDLDLTKKQLHIRRAVVKNRPELPKNHQLRVIDLAPILMKHLRPPTHTPRPTPLSCSRTAAPPPTSGY